MVQVYTPRPLDLARWVEPSVARIGEATIRGAREGATLQSQLDTIQFNRELQPLRMAAKAEQIAASQSQRAIAQEKLQQSKELFPLQLQMEQQKIEQAGKNLELLDKQMELAETKLEMEKAMYPVKLKTAELTAKLKNQQVKNAEIDNRTKSIVNDADKLIAEKNNALEIAQQQGEALKYRAVYEKQVQPLFDRYMETENEEDAAKLLEAIRNTEHPEYLSGNYGLQPHPLNSANVRSVMKQMENAQYEKVERQMRLAEQEAKAIRAGLTADLTALREAWQADKDLLADQVSEQQALGNFTIDDLAARGEKGSYEIKQMKAITALANMKLNQLAANPDANRQDIKFFSDLKDSFSDKPSFKFWGAFGEFLGIPQEDPEAIETAQRIRELGEIMDGEAEAPAALAREHMTELIRVLRTRAPGGVALRQKIVKGQTEFERAERTMKAESAIRLEKLYEKYGLKAISPFRATGTIE